MLYIYRVFAILKILALIHILKFYLNIYVGFENMRIFFNFVACWETNKQTKNSIFFHTHEPVCSGIFN